VFNPFYFYVKKTLVFVFLLKTFLKITPRFEETWDEFDTSAMFEDF